MSTDDKWTSLPLMVYGGFGVGKTYFAGSAVQVPEMRPVLLIDNDGGSRTLVGKSQFKGIKIFRVYQFEAYNKIYALIEANPTAFRTVIIDNLNEAHGMAMRLEMERVCAKDPTREPDVPSQREYGIVRAQIRKMLTFFNNLGINLIVTNHADLVKDEVGGHTYIRPALAGKLNYEAPGLLGIVGYLTVERKRASLAAKKGDEDDDLVRVMQFQPHRRIDAKDQTDALGFSIENPTIPKVVQLCTKAGVLDLNHK
jgi:hypothetical protein